MRSSIKNRLSFLVLICFLQSVSSAWAQTGTTSLHGNVLDSTRAAVEGASVTLANRTQGFSRRATTPSTGEFEFLALPPGTYVLTVEKAGFKKYEQTNLQLLVNVPTSVNVGLEVGAPTTQIEVSGQAPVINTEDATMGIAFGENQVKELPLEGRNVPDLLTLQPGVAYTGNRARHQQRRYAQWRGEWRAQRPGQRQSRWHSRERRGRPRFYIRFARDARFRAGVSRHHIQCQRRRGRN